MTESKRESMSQIIGIGFPYLSPKKRLPKPGSIGGGGKTSILIDRLAVLSSCRISQVMIIFILY
jgi:hypothetical protein